MADALEDDYIASDVEIDSDAGSGVEVDGIDGASSAGSEDGGSGGKDNGKRQRSAGDERRTASEGDDGDARAKKKRKLKERDRARKAKKAAANLALEPGSISRMPRDMQADHMHKLMRSCKAFQRMTDLELDEVGFKEHMIVDTSMNKTERSLEMAAEFVEQATKEAASTVKEQALDTKSQLGRPVVLFVSGNAQRAAELARALRPLLPKTENDQKSQKQAKGSKKGAASKSDAKLDEADNKAAKAPPVAVAKLFARHFKVSEQETFLQSHVCPVAVGTPQRLIDLLSSSDDTKEPALHVDALQTIVLDASWTDLKKRTLLDNAETRETVVSLLTMPAIQQRLRKSGRDVRQRTRLVFF